MPNKSQRRMQQPPRKKAWCRNCGNDIPAAFRQGHDYCPPCQSQKAYLDPHFINYVAQRVEERLKKERKGQKPPRPTGRLKAIRKA